MPCHALPIVGTWTGNNYYLTDGCGEIQNDMYVQAVTCHVKRNTGIPCLPAASLQSLRKLLALLLQDG